ncbi:uncharacterized protein LOC130664626 [Microplitis mediator]|uniref:uncharacterized protein LOC130664626 n=1 Tax=Microplitis mediator TaxID=375433 RepID=UPI0025537D0C|nr:uncharacterized protein LOC130664626 [Microplitis mediator]
MNIIMNDFQVKKNENGEYCLKSVCDYTNLSYKFFHRKFNKEYITRDELDSFLQKNKKYPEVDDFNNKLYLFEEHKWIEKVASIIKNNNFNLAIDALFIFLWTALENPIGVCIIPFVLRFMGFGGINSQFNYDKQLAEFVTFLKINEINYKLKKVPLNKFGINVSSLIFLTIDNFKNCIMLLNNCKAKEVKKYYIEFERTFNCYKNYTAKLEKQELLNKNEQLLKQNQESIKKLNEKETKVNDLIRMTSGIDNVINNIKMRNKDGYIYIATTKRYAEENLFKIGFSDNLKARLTALNTGKISAERFYYSYYKKAFNVRKVEKMIHDVLEDFRDSSKNEFFKLHYTFLSEIVNLVIKNINEPYEYVNDIIKHRLKEVYELRVIVPPEMPVVENNGLSELNFVNAFIKLIGLYGANQVSKIKRTELLSALQKELQSEFKKMEVWKIFKTQFKWKSSDIPICYGDYQITVVY